MSFQKYHRWGERNHDEIQRIIRGDDYTSNNWQLEDGDTVWNETFEGTMGAVQNKLTGSERGTFTDDTKSVSKITTASGPTSYFERSWLQYLGTGVNGVPGAGDDDGEFAAGIAWNSPMMWPGDQTGDLLTLQHSGIAYIKYNGTFQLQNHVSADTSSGDEGETVDSGSAGRDGDLGIQLNSSPGSGAITIKMNYSEHV